MFCDILHSTQSHKLYKLKIDTTNQSRWPLIIIIIIIVCCLNRLPSSKSVISKYRTGQSQMAIECMMYNAFVSGWYVIVFFFGCLFVLVLITLRWNVIQTLVTIKILCGKDLWRLFSGFTVFRWYYWFKHIKFGERFP